MRRCPCTVRRIHYHVFWLCYVDTPSLKMLSHLHDTPPRVCLDSRNACHGVCQGHRYIHQGVGGSTAFASILCQSRYTADTERNAVESGNNSDGCFLLSGHSDVLLQPSLHCIVQIKESEKAKVITLLWLLRWQENQTDNYSGRMCETSRKILGWSVHATCCHCRSIAASSKREGP
jgi:hypothetical protein